MVSLNKIEELFNAAIEMEDIDRQAQFIDEQDKTTAMQLRALLEQHKKPNSLLDAATNGVHDWMFDELKPGTCINDYRIVEKIGKGGMGTVYLAQQFAPINRQVALKVVNSLLPNDRLLARFDIEREALSRLDHSGIAKILDAGTMHQRQPFVVMEFIDGIPIDQFCNKNRIGLETRLQLVHQVCLAIHHAHQRGIIHRDIKPSNILVSPESESPKPKIIDFGISKLTDSQIFLKDEITRQGDLIGTLRYMSPEQFSSRSQEETDMRTDVYSLGVLLYELITGSTPIQAENAKQMGIVEWIDFAREQDFDLPSVRIRNSNTVNPQTRLPLSSQLQDRVAGELDWIIMKSLSKEPDHRYSSAYELAHDIQAYLTNKPVLAAPPSRRYLAWKFYQRNNIVVTTLAVAALTLLCLVAVSIYWAIANSKLERIANAKSKQLESQRNLLMETNDSLQSALQRAKDAELAANSLANEKREELAVQKAIDRFTLYRSTVKPDRTPRSVPPSVGESEVKKLNFAGFDVKIVGPSSSVSTTTKPLQTGMSAIVDKNQESMRRVLAVFGGEESKLFEFAVEEMEKEFKANHPIVNKYKARLRDVNRKD